MQLPHPRKARVNSTPFERHVAGINYGVLDQLAAYAVRRSQIAIYEELERVMTPLKITPPRFSSLVLIEQNPGVLQSDLAKLIGVGRSAMVSIIDFLEAQGWLKRESHDVDRRSNSLMLTAKGRTHLARAKALIWELDQGWTSALSASERQTLIALLDKVGPPRLDTNAR